QRSAFDLFGEVQTAMRKGSPAAAIVALEILAGRYDGRGEGGARTWLRLAVAWQVQSASSPRCGAPTEAYASAYGAYLRSNNDAERAEALSLLGNLLAREIEERPAADGCRPYQEAGDDSADHINNKTARRLAHQVFSTAGKLAADGHFGQQADALHKR